MKWRLLPKRVNLLLVAEVEITDGPFAGFVGIIEKIDEENERVNGYGKHFWQNDSRRIRF